MLTQSVATAQVSLPYILFVHEHLKNKTTKYIVLHQSKYTYRIKHDGFYIIL